MKKFFVTLLVCLMTSASLWAQDSKWGVGLNLGYGTDLSQAFLGGRVLYDIDDRFDVVGSFNRYFKDHGLKSWDINADFHWNVMFNITDAWKIGAELKGQIMSDSQFVPLVTAMYRF